ncbi:MAG: hypothetical protein IKL55_04260 [Clostridia bacterium]|nr:hypothetical protein [Clostridia bacterium]
MKKGNGFSIAGIFFIIIILGIVAFLAGDKIFGRNGMVEKITEADNEYNKAEIVDSLNLVIKEKYVLDYKYASENNLNPEEICTTENFFKYLLDSDYIEQLKDINDNLVEDQYYIKPNSLKSDIATSVINENGSESNGTKVYKIKKIEDKYLIYFVDKYGEEEELGELIINPDKIKEIVK